MFAHPCSPCAAPNTQKVKQPSDHGFPPPRSTSHTGPPSLTHTHTGFREPPRRDTTFSHMWYQHAMGYTQPERTLQGTTSLRPPDVSHSWGQEGDGGC